ncbi:hypothetical protein ABKN59_004886 [Abortiporus biennis]
MYFGHDHSNLSVSASMVYLSHGNTNTHKSSERRKGHPDWELTHNLISPFLCDLIWQKSRCLRRGPLWVNNEQDFFDS